MLSHRISIPGEREENIITVQRSVIESVRNCRHVYTCILCDFINVANASSRIVQKFSTNVSFLNKWVWERKTERKHGDNPLYQFKLNCTRRIDFPSLLRLHIKTREIRGARAAKTLEIHILPISFRGEATNGITWSALCATGAKCIDRASAPGRRAIVMGRRAPAALRLSNSRRRKG